MKRPVVLMSIIILSVAVVLGLAVGAYLFLKKSHAPHKPQPLSPAQQLALQVALPEMTTNLKNDGLIQFTLILQADQSSTKAEVTQMQPQIQDLLNHLMREFTATQLKQAGGYDELKQAIRTSVDKMLPKGSITAVDFSSIVVQ